MKKLVLVSFLVLTGCGAVQQAQINSGAKKAQIEIVEKCDFLLRFSDKEAMAWMNAKEPMTQCAAKYKKPWPQDKMLEISRCGTEVMSTKIRPVSHSKAKFDKMMKARQSEHEQYASGQIGWDELDELGMVRLDNYFNDANNGSYFSYANCHNAAFQKNVFPAYPNHLKPTLTAFMSKLSSFSRQADKKKLAPEDYQVGYQELWSEFASKEQTQIGQANAQNAQAWRDVSGQIMQAETERYKARQESLQKNRPTNTNCTVWNDTMNCTTW